MAGDAPTVRPSPDPSRPDDGAPEPLRCARCQHPVTRPALRVAHAGAHHHTFTNPHGYVFRVGCFSAAPGAAIVGAATRAHTWFPGLAWRMGLCGQCGTHLGWGFVHADGQPALVALILDQLC